MIRIGLTAAAALVAAGPASAQVDGQVVRELAGSYQLVPTDGRPTCRVELSAVRVGDNAWRATPDACAHVPAFAGIAAWRPEDGTLLLDGSGNTQMHFVEDETALASFPDLRKPLHYLVPAISGFTHLLQPHEWVGRWKIARSGKAICSIGLSRVQGAPAIGRIDASGCARRSPASRLTGWSLEGMRLMLWGPEDQLLAFAPQGQGRWAAEPGGWTLSK